MKMWSLGAIAAVLAAFSAPAYAAVMNDLPQSQRQQLESGQMVVKSSDVSGGIWPKLIVYTIINAPPAVVKDLLMDYKSAPTYNSSLIAAKVVATPSADVKDVEYTEKVPIFGNVSYTVRNTYRIGSNGGLTISWDLLQSPLASESTGSITVEKYGNASVMRYVNYVRPKSSIAIVAKGAALDSVKKTVAAIKQEAERRAGAVVGR